MTACPACLAELPGEFAYCPHCGAAQGAPPRPEATERKVVSVLFCDLVGFTEASEAADPEDVASRLRRYHALSKDLIEGYGGTVEKFIGDAVMAVFGVPVAHEDDPERAVRAGLRILEVLSEVNRAEPHLSLHVRVGVNTGEALVSVDPRPGVGLATGDVVNTAARIQSSAPTDAVAVGESTYRATTRVFEYEELPSVMAKGKAQPLGLWRAGAAVSRVGSGLTRNPGAPLIGRETDLQILKLTFKRATQEQSPQLVTILGEPGVGKSRLVSELLAEVDADPDFVTWRQGRCLPYGEGVTFFSLAEIVKAHAGIYDSDDEATAVAKLEATLEGVPDNQWLQQRLAPLAGIAGDTPAGEEENFTAWRRFLEHIANPHPTVIVIEDIHWAEDPLLRFIEHVAGWTEHVPLLIICTARPELFDSRPTWAAGLLNATPIRLSRLSDTQTSELLGTLMGDVALASDTKQAIIERAEGNPLYAEEMARILSDRGLLDGEGNLTEESAFPLPEGIQALIAARLDTLSLERKALLSDGAVLGAVFWAGALAAMGGRVPDEVVFEMHELGRKELVRSVHTSTLAGESEFAFWHALVRDVAYAAIPRAARATRHIAAADWFEDNAERVDEAAPFLLHHLGTALQLAETTGDTELVAELTPRVRDQAVRAAERAVVMDTEGAMKLLGRALSLTPGDDPVRADILLRMGTALSYVARFPEAEEALEEAVELFRTQTNVGSTARTLLRLSMVRFYLGNPSCLELDLEAVALLETLPPAHDLVEALAELAHTYMCLDHLAQAIDTADQAIELASRIGVPLPGRALSARGLSRLGLGDPGGIDQGTQAIAALIAAGQTRNAAVAWMNLSHTISSTEGPRVSLEIAKEVEEFARSRGQRHILLSLSASNLAPLIQLGELDQVVREAASVVRRCEESSDMFARLQTRRSLATAMLLTGRPGAVALAREVLEDSRGMEKQTAFVTLALDTVALAESAAGNVPETVAALTEVLSLLDEENDFSFLLPSLVRSALEAGRPELAAQLAAKGRLQLRNGENAQVTVDALLAEARGEFDVAELKFADARQRWQEFDDQLEEAYATMGQGRTQLAMGDERADSTLGNARALFSAMGALPLVAECDHLLAGVPSGEG
jgi:class 3 adenylate cyclase/tetratricopeptide (TPR) repeat protein